MNRTAGLLLATLVLAGCASARTQHVHGSSEVQSFWGTLQALCGRSFEGGGIHVPPADTAFAGRRMVMHVAQCDANEVRIPFHVGDDRSRTWVVRRVGSSLELKHIHRHEDGTESSNTNYGGTSASPGTPHRQEFPADAVSVAAVPARAGAVSGASFCLRPVPRRERAALPHRVRPHAPGCGTCTVVVKQRSAGGRDGAHVLQAVVGAGIPARTGSGR